LVRFVLAAIRDNDRVAIGDQQPVTGDGAPEQMIGRGLRIAEGKDKLLVLDHAGNA
jgi:hypothetical protein